MRDGQEVLEDWITRYGLSHELAGELLGAHRNTIGDYRLGRLKVSGTALYAIAAVSAGLRPVAVPHEGVDVPLIERLAMSAMKMKLDPFEAYEGREAGPLDAWVAVTKAKKTERRSEAARKVYRDARSKPAPRPAAGRKKERA